MSNAIQSPEVTAILDKLNLDEQENSQDDKILANLTAMFDDISIINVEKYFQKRFVDVEGKEIQYFGVVVYFYEKIDPTEFIINFRMEGKFEQLGEIKDKIVGLIHQLGGKLID